MDPEDPAVKGNCVRLYASGTLAQVCSVPHVGGRHSHLTVKTGPVN